MITTLLIGSVQIPTETLADFEQRYEDISGQTFRRLASGDGVLRTLWSGKLRTTIRGKGWVPGFENFAPGTSHVIACAMPRSVSDATISIALPVSRRSDAGHTPQGFALVGDRLVDSAITDITANVATLTAVAGASGYRVHYYPLITAVITEATSQGVSAAQFEWQIEAEEL